MGAPFVRLCPPPPPPPAPIFFGAERPWLAPERSAEMTLSPHPPRHHRSDSGSMGSRPPNLATLFHPIRPYHALSDVSHLPPPPFTPTESFHRSLTPAPAGIPCLCRNTNRHHHLRMRSGNVQPLIALSRTVERHFRLVWQAPIRRKIICKSDSVLAVAIDNASIDWLPMLGSYRPRGAGVAQNLLPCHGYLHDNLPQFPHRA